MPAAPPRHPSSVAPVAPVAPAVPADAIGPNPPGRRLLLLCKLLLIPVAAVCLPTLVVTHFFGQGPRPKTEPPDAAFVGLRESLERAARERLPETTNPAATFGTRFEELTLSCPPAEADARLETLRDLAVRCGGTVTEQPADATGRHLLVELNEADLARFREGVAATNHTPEAAPASSSAPVKPASAGEKVFLNVTLAPAP